MRRTLIAMSLLVAACGGSPDRGDSSAGLPAGPWQAHYPKDVQVVFDTVPQWTEATAWRVGDAPELVIPGDATLGNPRFVRAAKRAPDGSIVVGLMTEARWFDSTGTLLRVLGRKGEGPGEYEYLDQVEAIGNDTVMLGQGGMRWKNSWFGRDGTLLREERLDIERFYALGRWTECPGYRLPTGGWLGCMRDTTVPESATNRRAIITGEYSSHSPGLLRALDRYAVATPTLDAVHPLGLEIGLEQFIVDLGQGRHTSVLHPFYARTFVAFAGTPLRIALLTNPEDRIEIWTPEGVLERVIGRRGGRFLPTAEERAYADSIAWAGVERSDPNALGPARAAVTIPDSLPAGWGLVMSRTGHLFVTRGFFGNRTSPTRVDVFGADGHWLGTLHLPPQFRVLDAGPDFVLGTRLDEDGVPRVERWRLTRP